MSDTHSKIIESAARDELESLGFQRKGRSRLWLADRGSWLNVVDFTPSKWTKSVSLINAAHWLWTGAGFMSLNVALSSNCRAHFESTEQFRSATIEIAKVAREKALEIEGMFPSFEAIADFVVEQARSSPDRMGRSWWGYEAGIASGLIGRLEDANHFLRGLTDERVTIRAAPLLPLIDRPEAFKTKIYGLIAEERSRLKLAALNSSPF